MGYLVEQYRKGDEELMHKIHEAKMLLCEVLDELSEPEESRNYRMNNRNNYKMSNRGRYDY